MGGTAFTLKAIALTLAIHAMVLLVLWWPTWGSTPPATRYAEVGLMEELVDVETQTLEERLRAGIEGQVANLQSDARAVTASELRSTSGREMAEAVEAELRAFEAAEMARLAAEAKDFGLEGVPEVEQGEVETLAGWDAQYDGNVTVKFDLAGRRAKHLDVPGYRCQGGAEVVVQIEVDRKGAVRSAALSPALAAQLAPCFAESALESARRSSFYIEPTAEPVTRGTLTYIFVPQ